MALRRALTLQNIADSKVSRFSFTGDWFDAFGNPQSTGIWFIYGESGSGKTTFVLELIKYLAGHVNSVFFESLEEGELSAALKDNIVRLGMSKLKNVLVIEETLEEMKERLEQRKSPDVFVIDSVEHSEFKTVDQILELKRKYKKKLFVFVGQASGDRPRTTLGESILFIANQKIKVEGYKALSRGRSSGVKKYFTVWEEEAIKYWNK
jgi:nucleoside-triphosphatase THEP1